MEKRSVIMIVILFVLIVAGMFIYAFIKNQEIEEQIPDEQGSETNDDQETPYDDITRIDAKHFYSDGTHTLVGEVVMPTPCDLLEADASVAESFPEQVQIEFTVVNTADVCAQVLTPQRFMVTAGASEEATFSATFEGRPIELNLIEAAPGETPEDFELFIKG